MDEIKITLETIGDWTNRLDFVSSDIIDRLETETDSEIKSRLNALSKKIDELVEQFDELADIDTLQEREV